MIEVALFGAGRIGKIHAANLAAQPGVQFKYVVDVNQEAAAALAGLHGGSSATVEAALADPAIKAVVIASSTDTHADLILRSAAAGKAIFCEKPVDLTLDRARACAAAVKEAKVMCMLGFQRRYDPTFNAVKTRIEAGEIGTPELLIVTSRDPGPPPVSYIKVSGGIFKDMLIHDFDIFRWILDDEAVSVHATGSCLVDPAIGEAGDLDTAVVTIRTAKGRLCQINASRRAAYGYDQRIEALGSKGMLLSNNRTHTALERYTEQATGMREPLMNFFLDRYQDAFRLQMDAFVAALTQKQQASPSFDDGYQAQRLAEAAYRSLTTGQSVRLD